MYRRLLAFLRPHWWRMAGAITCNLCVAALDTFSITLLIPFLNALFGKSDNAGAIGRVQELLVGAFLDEGDVMGSLRNIMVVILMAVALKSVFVWLSGQLAASLQELVARDLRNTVYSHLQRLPLPYFTRVKTGQILARVLNDTAQSKQVVTEAVTRSLQSAAMVVTALVVLFLLSWRLSLLALVIAPLLIAMLQPLLRKLRKGHRRLSSQYGDMTAVVQEAVSGARLVKSFSGEDYEERRFREASDRYSRDQIKVTRVAYLAQPITETVGTAIAVTILWIGAREVVSGQMTGATLIAFIGLTLRMLQPLKQLSQVPTVAQQSLAAAERVMEVLDSSSEYDEDKGTRTVGSFERTVEFDRVTFAYEEDPVLDDVSFTARRGDVVALVGASGAGKTTLVDLIPRFYEPDSGSVLLDGVDTREITLRSLRALTGIVSQDTVMFNDTVRRNIAYGAAGRFTDEQVIAAARAANAHDFIMELPAGYDTVVGERGTRLSGGQRQRLAIARALLVDPPILILDEATSSLDSESERLVQDAIERLLRGRTVFVIAHRLSTIMHATTILVLDRGRVVERGTHEELLARRGLYHRLHALQFAERLTTDRGPDRSSGEAA